MLLSTFFFFLFFSSFIIIITQCSGAHFLLCTSVVARDCSVSKFASSRNAAGRHFRLAWPDRHMAYMTPDEIARQHAAFFGSYVGFLVVSSAAGLLLAFFHKIRALMKYPALRVVVKPEDFVTREEDDGSAWLTRSYQGGRRFDEGA